MSFADVAPMIIVGLAGFGWRFALDRVPRPVWWIGVALLFIAAGFALANSGLLGGTRPEP